MPQWIRPLLLTAILAACGTILTVLWDMREDVAVHTTQIATLQTSVDRLVEVVLRQYSSPRGSAP